MQRPSLSRPGSPQQFRIVVSLPLLDPVFCSVLQLGHFLLKRACPQGFVRFLTEGRRALEAVVEDRRAIVRLSKDSGLQARKRKRCGARGRPVQAAQTACLNGVLIMAGASQFDSNHIFRPQKSGPGFHIKAVEKRSGRAGEGEGKGGRGAGGVEKGLLPPKPAPSSGSPFGKTYPA